MYDAVVVGAGPAGSACALHLCRRGLRVVVVEQTPFPRTKACGEYLSSSTVAALKALNAGAGLETQAFELQGVRISSGNARVAFDFHAPAWSLPRASLDAALLSAAQNAGARAVYARVQALEAGDRAVRIGLRSAEGVLSTLEARVAVGADGTHSAVARLTGLAVKPKSARRFALGGHFENVTGLDRYVHMFVDGKSYFALNPLSPTTANAMLIVNESDLRAHRDDVDAYFDSRAKKLAANVCAFDTARPIGKRIAVGPLAHRTRAFTAPGVLLAGDAAYFVDPFTGQGVRLALYAARLAADAVTSFIMGTAPQHMAWRTYSRELSREIARRRRNASLASAAVRLPALAPFARAFTPLVEAVTA